jgi:hypothetical protein
MSDPSNSMSEDRSSAEDFAHHHDYSTLMLGARRHAAPHIGAPAITRHLGFWLPDDLTLTGEGSMTLKRDKWIELIEGSFVALYLRLTKLSEVSTSNVQKKGDGAPRLYLIHHSYPIEEGGDRKKQCIEGAKELPIRHQRVLVSFVWQSMPVLLTLEMFDEYFTLSTTIDLSRCPASNKLREAIETFNNLASKRYDESKYAVAHAPQESEFTGAFKAIYYTAWEKLYKDIFPAPLSAYAATLGKVFAEFRGFVACRGESQFIATDGKVDQPLEKEIGNKHFNRENAIRCVDTIRPFMAADAWLHRGEDDKLGANCPEPREFTFTTVLSGRYIYASALGTPPSHLRDSEMPLTYMLLSANHSPSELGLLVDAFHVLGTTRLAALYDFPHVTHAALELRDLEGDISALLRGMMEGKPDEDMAAARERLTQELPTFSGRLAKIEQAVRSEDDDKRTQAALELHELERDTSKLHRSMMQGKTDDDVAAAVERLAQKLCDFSGRLAKIEQGIRSDKRTHAALQLHELERDISKLHRNVMQGKTGDDVAAAVERLAQKLCDFSGRLAKIEQGIRSEGDDKRTNAALELRDLEGDISALLRSMMQGKTDDDVAAVGERLAQELPAFSTRLAKIEQCIRSDKRTHAALELHELERDISKLHRSMMEGKTDDDAAAARERLARKLRDFSGRFTKIEQGISSDHNDKRPQIVGGLPFRVERSHYYQRQFRDLVRGLRIGRIQGFQTYDEAVARRLGGIYDLIDTVGLRHERVREILVGLSRRMQSARQIELTTAITAETRTIEKLQEGAEIGFFAVLFPYYVSHILIEVADKLQLARHFPSVEHRLGIDKTFLFLSIVGGVTLAFYRSLKRRFKVSPANAGRFKFFLFVIVLVVTLLLSAVSARYHIVDILPVIAR